MNEISHFSEFDNVFPIEMFQIGGTPEIIPPTMYCATSMEHVNDHGNDLVHINDQGNDLIFSFILLI